MALALGVWWWLGRGKGRAAYPIPGEGDRVIVQVLNAAGADGLARETTRRLRRRGFDVVDYGTASLDTLSVTRIIIRRGDSTPAGRVRDALGAGEIVAEPDPRLLVDVSVLVGRDLAPPLHLDP